MAAPIASGPPLCRAAGVTVRLVGGQGAAGHLYNVFEMVNTSRQPCHTQGYAGVGLIGADNKPAPVATSRDPEGDVVPGPQPNPQPLTLVPGSAALFTLAWQGNPPNGQSSCPNYARLIVTPPDDTAATTADLGTGYMANGLALCGPIEIRPLEAEPPRCSIARLTFDLTSAGPTATQPGRGLAFVTVTNNAIGPCRMFGWPGLQLVGPSGASLPTTATRVDGPPRLAIVGPKEATSFAFTWDTGCANPEVPAQLKITPPDDTANVTISAKPNGTVATANGLIAVCQGKVQIDTVG